METFKKRVYASHETSYYLDTAAFKLDQNTMPLILNFILVDQLCNHVLQPEGSNVAPVPINTLLWRSFSVYVWGRFQVSISHSCMEQDRLSVTNHTSRPTKTHNLNTPNPFFLFSVHQLLLLSRKNLHWASFIFELDLPQSRMIWSQAVTHDTTFYVNLWIWSLFSNQALFNFTAW